jgi:hypothetical protein
MPLAICLDAIGEPGEVRVTKNLSPTSQVEPGLRSEIWKLDGDRHAGVRLITDRFVRSPGD